MLRRRKTPVTPFRIARKLGGNESGVTLIETMIALALLALIAAALLGGLATAAQATFLADERATAESLARSQMEYVKTLNYEYGTTQYSPAPIPSGKDYSGYSVTIAAEPLHDSDDGIQKITVTVSHTDKLVLTVEDYKVDRIDETE